MKVRVRTVEVENPPTDWTEEAKRVRRFGVEGVIVESHDGHGLCYGVQHDEDGQVGFYEPRELVLIGGPERG